MKLRSLMSWIVSSLVLVTVCAGCGGGGGATQTVSPQSVTLTANKTQAIASTADSVTVTATVTDSNGSPVAGQTISFNVPQGFYPYLSTGETGPDGTAIIHLRYRPIGPDRTDVVPVSATSGAVTSNEILLSFSNPQNAATVTLEAERSTVSAAGNEMAKLVATVRDAAGAPLAGQRVDFAIPAGFFAGISLYTNEAGISSLSFRPDGNRLNVTQTVSVTASSGAATSAPVEVTFIAEPFVLPQPQN